jgi:response regulator of citrate/malate metabolism
VADWRVLIVEDDEVVARVHCRYVSGRPGFSVVGVASSGAQARRLVETLRPHLILLDLQLPGGHGIPLLRELRRKGDPAEVIVITGHAESEVVRAGVQLGVVDYLVKPFWLGRLGEALTTFTTRMETLGADRLSQEAVDRVRGGPGEPGGGRRAAIRKDRLEQVRSALASSGVAVSADEVAASTGMARVTARRYLEHLVAAGLCTVDQMADGPGRPRKLYRPWLSGTVGAPDSPMQTL